MKKFFVLLCLIFFAGLVFSDSISNYYVKPEVHLDKVMTVTGSYSDGSNVQCKAVIYESDGNVLKRLTDQYTFSDSSFYFEERIKEPEYWRGRDYNVVVTCGSAVSSSEVFSVLQRETITPIVQSEIQFFTLPGNTDPALFLGAIFAAIVVFAILVYGGYKFVKRYP